MNIARSFLMRVVALVALLSAPSLVLAQGVELAGRPVADIRIEGLEDVPQQLVRNQIRLQVGNPYDPEIVQQDIVRITHLGRFESVQVRAEPTEQDDLRVTYVVEEQPLLADVQVVGNKALTDQELLGLIVLQPGDPIDPFLIDQARQRIAEAYEDKGYFVTDVTYDQQLLEEQGILILRVREGPNVRIREIRYQGNDRFTAKQLRSQIQSRTYIWLLRKGELSREQLDQDAARLRDFYRDRGYLDAQVGRQIEISPDQRSAAVTFVIDEGRRYTVESIRFEGNDVFPEWQIRQAMTLKEGAIFAANELNESVDAVQTLYGKLGFIETQVVADRLFHEDEPKVDLVVRVEENKPYLVGQVLVRGNEMTKDNVILRQVRGMEPGKRFDRAGIEQTQRRLRESSLFDDARVSVLQPEGDSPYRDVAVEVREANTGSVSFGAGVSSDAGVVGAIDLVQRNFDIADVPESWGEFLTGRAFRGAGQYFALTLQPGNERSQYSVTFRDPYFLESDYFLSTRAFLWSREREDYDESRLGGSAGIGRRFGDVWQIELLGRAEQIEIDSIDDSAPVDVFDEEGDNFLTSFGLELQRRTTDSVIFPTRGSVWTIGLNQVGALGGDYNFTRLSTEFRKFWTVDEDFFGRETVLSMRSELGYIFQDNEAPVFERFYAGGHRSFRGFDYRGVGPRGIENDSGNLGDDPVGGDFMFLLGLEYNFPLVQDSVRGVFFTDTGTVDEDFDLGDYRVAVGAGLRIKIPFLGQAPFAVDFAVPILEEEGDETRVFSFDLAVPF